MAQSKPKTIGDMTVDDFQILVNQAVEKAIDTKLKEMLNDYEMRPKPKFKVTNPEFTSLLKEYVDYANEHYDEIVERVTPQIGQEVLETYEEILPAISAALEAGMGEWEE